MQVFGVISSVERWKAGGLSGILVLYGGALLSGADTGGVGGRQGSGGLEECCGGPHPQEGDLKVCDNWKGISLLDVVEKILARIV